MESLWQNQRRTAACGFLTGVFLVTAVVLSRRISGDASGFESEWAATLTGAAALAVSLLCITVRGLLGETFQQSHRIMAVVACGLPGVMLGLSLMPPGSSSGLACLLGLYAVAVVGGSAWSTAGQEPITSLHDQHGKLSGSSFARHSFDSGAEKSPDTTSNPLEHGHSSPEIFNTQYPAAVESIAGSTDTPLADSQLESPEDAAFADDGALPFDLNEPLPHPGCNPETTQWMSRSTVEGTDVAEGAFRVAFEPGQKLAAVHLPFSPPLAGTPEFECEPVDESDVRLRTTAVHSYGIRVEVTRSSGLDEAETVELGWMASAAISEAVAA